MTYEFNFHRRIGTDPSFGITFTNYGIAGVLMLRLWWSAFTVAFDIPKRYRKVESEETRFYRKMKAALLESNT